MCQSGVVNLSKLAVIHNVYYVPATICELQGPHQKVHTPYYVI